MEEKRKILKGDRYIWGAYIGLCVASIMAMFSASGTLTYNSDDIYAPIIKHVSFLFASAAVVYVVHHIHYKFLRLLGFPLFIISSLMLIYTLFFGEKINDAARWIEIAGIPIQPSELAKLGVIITTSYFLAKGQVEKGVSNDALKKNPYNYYNLVSVNIYRELFNCSTHRIGFVLHDDYRWSKFQ